MNVSLLTCICISVYFVKRDVYYWIERRLQDILCVVMMVIWGCKDVSFCTILWWGWKRCHGVVCSIQRWKMSIIYFVKDIVYPSLPTSSLYTPPHDLTPSFFFFSPFFLGLLSFMQLASTFFLLFSLLARLLSFGLCHFFQ